VLSIHCPYKRLQRIAGLRLAANIKLDKLLRWVDVDALLWPTTSVHDVTFNQMSGHLQTHFHAHSLGGRAIPRIHVCQAGFIWLPCRNQWGPDSPFGANYLCRNLVGHLSLSVTVPVGLWLAFEWCTNYNRSATTQKAWRRFAWLRTYISQSINHLFQTTRSIT